MNEPAQLAAAGVVEVLGTTPTGTQAERELKRRRLGVLAVTGVTYLALAAAMARVAGAGGWTAIDLILCVCFLVAAPWTVLGFWNAGLGIWLLHGRKDGLAQAAPFAAAAASRDPIRVRTAVLMTLRNEDCARAFRRLETVKASIEATGEGRHFAYFVLSDTSDPDVAAAEEAAVAAWRAEAHDPERIVYRRRAHNTGFKAGNLRDFCRTHGRAFELMLPLDADSLMAGETIVRMVRVMQAHPRLGILQSLVVGAPSQSAFARIFQFGMRHGMRPYTVGHAWWTGDCGPFWGHNALVRIAPFVEHCDLPMLPGKPPLGGHILSHDQVEAVLMRRAGYEVRVWPKEGGSWEENPPTLFAFSARDLRWCQGNMQYWRLVGMPGLEPMSRFQLAWAILMFLGVPATTLMIALAPLKAFDSDVAVFPATLAAALYLTFLGMYLSPKLAGLADVLLSKGGVARYGGVGRFLLGAGIEAGFSFLLGAVTTFRLTLFMAGLPFGRAVAWNGQARDAHGIGWRLAIRELWPPVLFGSGVAAALAFVSPATLWWSLPLTLGYLVAAPFAVLTASPALGAFMARHKLCAIPEEIDVPPEIEALQREAA
jgi:membrane glycosyltransferase